MNAARTDPSKASLTANWDRKCDRSLGQEEEVTSREAARPVTFAIRGAKSETKPGRFFGWRLKHWRNC
jgi:hypothetical protein